MVLLLYFSASFTPEATDPGGCKWKFPKSWWCYFLVIYLERAFHYKPSIWGHPISGNSGIPYRVIWLEIRCDKSVISTTPANNVQKSCKLVINKGIQKGFLPDCILNFATTQNQSKSSTTRSSCTEAQGQGFC